MFDNHDNPLGWVRVGVRPETEAKARAMRADRDRQYGNIYSEAATDKRWVGDLGEMVLARWFEHANVTDVKWIVDDAAGKPDFILPNGISIDAKTVKRKSRPYPNYTAQISADHAGALVDQLFFMNYQFSERRMWLLGGIDKKRFLEEATYYRSGEKVHENYTPQGHAIYNIELYRLIPPYQWLQSLTK